MAPTVFYQHRPPTTFTYDRTGQIKCSKRVIYRNSDVKYYFNLQQGNSSCTAICDQIGLYIFWLVHNSIIRRIISWRSWCKLIHQHPQSPYSRDSLELYTPLITTETEILAALFQAREHMKLGLMEVTTTLRFIHIQDSDQTFTVPNDITGTKEILVEVWGAGGAGTV
jgi:hypothetical protein